MGAGVGVWVLDRGQGGVTMLREGGKEMSHLDIWGESAPRTEDTNIQTPSGFTSVMSDKQGGQSHWSRMRKGRSEMTRQVRKHRPGETNTLCIKPGTQWMEMMVMTTLLLLLKQLACTGHWLGAVCCATQLTWTHLSDPHNNP